MACKFLDWALQEANSIVSVGRLLSLTVKGGVQTVSRHSTAATLMLLIELQWLLSKLPLPLGSSKPCAHSAHPVNYNNGAQLCYTNKQTNNKPKRPIMGFSLMVFKQKVKEESGSWKDSPEIKSSCYSLEDQSLNPRIHMLVPVPISGTATSKV